MRRIPGFVALLCGLRLLAPLAMPAQHPASQLELNGFLIGQHHDAIAGAFPAIFHEDTTTDGWINRAYIIDRPHHAYMAFKFPADRRDYAISVQIAGQPGTAMLPFLGIRLGDSARAVERKLGPPSTVTPEPELRLQLWGYTDRNYSVEIDSTNRVSSIQIFGYDGLPEKDPGDGPDPLQRLRAAIAKPDVDSLVAIVAPDLEIYRDSDVVQFGRSARGKIADSDSRVRSLLLDGPRNLRSILLSGASVTDTAVRVSQFAPVNQVYKFGGALSELVFTYVPGGWRLWEVRFP